MKSPLSSLFHARDKPKNVVSTAPAFFFGTSGAGKSVSVQSAIQVSTVYACVRVIAETIASLPLHVYKATNDGSAKAVEHPPNTPTPISTPEPKNDTPIRVNAADLEKRLSSFQYV